MSSNLGVAATMVAFVTIAQIARLTRPQMYEVMSKRQLAVSSKYLSFASRLSLVFTFGLTLLGFIGWAVLFGLITTILFIEKRYRDTILFLDKSRK